MIKSSNQQERHLHVLQQTQEKHMTEFRLVSPTKAEMLTQREELIREISELKGMVATIVELQKSGVINIPSVPPVE